MKLWTEEVLSSIVTPTNIFSFEMRLILTFGMNTKHNNGSTPFHNNAFMNDVLQYNVTFNKLIQNFVRVSFIA